MKAGRKSQGHAERDAKIADLAMGVHALGLDALAERFGLTKSRIAQIVGKARMQESQGFKL